MCTKEQSDPEKRRLRAEYGVLFDHVAAILFRHDPFGINFECNTDEYEPEASTILPRLRTCNSAEDVLTVLHEEFTRWFDADIAGPRERYSTIANEVWALWQKSRVP
jgi:hypothetical protein